MRVSKREAFLLFILALVGIVGMMLAFIILPLMNEVNANKLVLEDLNNQKLIIDTSIPNEANLKKQLETRLVEVSDLLHTFESPINEAQFERWVLPLTTKYNMKVLETNFTDVELTTPLALINLFISPLPILDHFIGFFIISIPFYIIAYLTGGIGGGDIKLIAIAGLLLGYQATLVAFFIASILGGCMAIYLLLTKQKDRKSLIAFGPYLCIGIYFAYLYGNQIFTWYLNFFS